MRRGKRGVLTILLVLLLLLSGCGMAIGEILSGGREQEREQVQETLAELRQPAPVRLERSLYERPDQRALARDIKACVRGIEDSKDWQEALDWLEQAQRVMDEVDSMYILSEFFLDSDLMDEDAYEEYLACGEIYELSSEWWVDIYYAVRSSDFSELLLPVWNPPSEKDSPRCYNSFLADSREEELEAIADEAVEIIENATVIYEGEEMTLDDTDYADNWEAAYSLWLETHGPTLLELYTDLARAGGELAREGYRMDSFTEYRFRELGRQYTPEQAAVLVEDIILYMSPLDDELTEAGYWSKMYDDYLPREEFLNAVVRTARAMDRLQEQGEINAALTLLRDYELWEDDDGWYVLSRPYTTYLPLYRIPIMLSSYSGNVQDALNFLHEFGHFYEFYVMEEDNSSRDDLSELHSQAFSLLFTQQHGDELLQEQVVVDAVDTLVYQSWNAAIELAVFDLPPEELSTELVGRLGTQSVLRFGYQGTQAMERYSWLTDTELFTDPLQPFSYASSGAVALELWKLSHEDMETALLYYEDFVERNGGESLLENAQALKLDAPFYPDWAEGMAQELRDYLDIAAENAA